jgi:hypothetical protein
VTTSFIISCVTPTAPQRVMRGSICCYLYVTRCRAQLFSAPCSRFTVLCMWWLCTRGVVHRTGRVLRGWLQNTTLLYCKSRISFILFTESSLKSWQLFNLSRNSLLGTARLISAIPKVRRWTPSWTSSVQNRFLWERRETEEDHGKSQSG